ncbi:MAG: hypothetical protein RSB00_04315 [Bacilli bacterium]
MKEEFLLLSKIKWVYSYSDKYIYPSFPKVFMTLKIELEKQLLKLLELVYSANYNRGSIRQKYQREILVCVGMCDSLIGLIKDKKIITNKRFLAFTNALNEIRVLNIGWMESIEKGSFYNTTRKEAANI